AGCRKTKATAVVLAPNGDQVPPLRPQACHPRLLLPHASANGKTSHNYVEVNAIANASLMCASDQRTPIDLLFPHVLLQHRRGNSLTRDPIKSRSVRRLYQIASSVARAHPLLGRYCLHPLACRLSPISASE